MSVTNYELSRGEICVANFKAPLQMVQVKKGYLSQFVNMGSSETILKVPMLKIIGLKFSKSNLNRGHFKKSVEISSNWGHRALGHRSERQSFKVTLSWLVGEIFLN